MIYAIIIKPAAPLKKEASFSSSIEDEAVYGMKVLILCRCGEWYKVRTHYRYEGFIHCSNLMFDADKIKMWDRYGKKSIIKNNADILYESKYQSSILMSLPKSAQTIVISAGSTECSASSAGGSSYSIEGLHCNADGFTYIQLADGKRGYIRSDFLSGAEDAGYEDHYYRQNIDKGITARYYINEFLKKSEEEFRKGLVLEAITYLGTQYRWGGRTPLGIDCSGLCFTAYMLNGLIIFRDSVIKEGFPIKRIKYEDVKPGDLMYFPGHIAMYIGENRYIHSTGKKGSSGVVINSLNPDDEVYRQDLHEALYAAGSVF